MNRFRQDKPHQSAQEKSERPRPLREFNTGPHKSSSSVMPGRFMRNFSWLLPLAVFCAIIAVAGIIVLKSYDRGEASTDANEEAAFTTYSGPMEASELLNGYLNAIGGRSALNEVRSIRYDGRVVFGSSAPEVDFQMLLSLPDKGMLITNPGNPLSVKLMLNGDTAWRVMDRQDGSREVIPLKESEMRSLQWSMRVHNTFLELALDGRTAGLSVKEVEFMDQPCYEVTKTMADGSIFTAFLNRETLYLVKTVETLSMSDGSESFTVVYDDHRMVSGVVEPYNTKLYRNGELDNQVIVERIQINPGVMSALFEIPEELKK